MPVVARQADADAGETQPSTLSWFTTLANERMRAWLVGLAGVRDALGRLPSIPPVFWFSGAGVLVILLATRVARFRKVMATARPAPGEVEALVRLVADHIGLRATPRAFMVDARISPMIYCGRSTRLILPLDLWNQLDRDGRLAILSHELAHVRRRDHWVCWMETLIGCLFWWHPVLWWVRRRLHEEAEYCCDAWVTWLMPHGRRAYAEALLHTKGYLAGHRGCAPAVGVGMTTTRTQRFARRLKMVMTDRSKPGLSLAGLTLVVALASAGWAATPCPDKKVQAAKVKQAAPVVVVQPFAQPSLQTRVTAPTVASPIGLRTTLVAPTINTTPLAMQPAVIGGVRAPAVVTSPFGPTATFFGDEKDVEKRLSKLEKQLEKLSQQLERIADAKADAPSGARGRGGVRSVPAVPSVPSAPAAPAIRSSGRGGRASVGGGSGGGVGRISVGGISGGGGAVEIRTYELPEGKLEALVQLMIRGDVPVPVAQRDGAIEVHATPDQHAVLKAFIDLIHPDGKSRSANDDEGSRFGSGAAAGQWRAAMADAQRAIESNPDGAAAAIYADAIKQNQAAREGAMKAAEQWQRQAQNQQRAALREAQRVQQRAQRQAQVEQRRAQSRQREDHADALGNEMEALERHAEELREMAESLSEKMEAIQESDKPDDDAVRGLRDQMRSMEREARNVERRARELEKQADQLREESERINEEADAILEEADFDEDENDEEMTEAADLDLDVDEMLAEHAVLAHALASAARAIHEEARPEAVEALSAATAFLREGAPDAARQALVEAAEAMATAEGATAEINPLLQRVLADSAAAMKQDTPNVVARLLEQAAEAMKSGGAAEAQRVLREAVDALNAEAKARAESPSGGR